MMTAKEFFEGILDSDLDIAYKAYANYQLAKIGEKEIKRKEKAKPINAANEEIKDSMLRAMVIGKWYSSRQVAEKLGLTSSKIAAMFRQLAAEGKVEVTDGFKDRGSVVKGYRILAAGVNSLEV